MLSIKLTNEQVEVTMTNKKQPNHIPQLPKDGL